MDGAGGGGGLGSLHWRVPVQVARATGSFGEDFGGPPQVPSAMPVTWRRRAPARRPFPRRSRTAVPVGAG